MQMSSKTATPNPLSAKPAWLLFILTLQGQQPAVRMRVWRALKALGTAVLRDGVYLLPNRSEFHEPLRAQSEDVITSGGSAQILEANARDANQEAEFRRFFDRTPEYEKLLRGIGSTGKQINGVDSAALTAQLIRLRRDYDAIVQQDFFPGAARDQAHDALEDLARAASAVLSPDEPHAATGRIRRVDSTKYRGRTWASRARPWADRLASAWLIKRCIDPQAKFLWLKNPKDCPKRAVGFDFDGAEFTHVGTKVTFEVLVASFGLEGDPALVRIGALIHYLDVGGVPVPEAIGVEALLRGAHGLLQQDDSLVVEGAKLFEFLYVHYAGDA
jgi:hypothetical protein